MDNDQQHYICRSILTKWGATPDQIHKILPLDQNCHQVERLNCILSIENSLKILFENPSNQYGFMSMKNHNEFFLGRTPLDIISLGSLEDLMEVEKRIRTLIIR